MAQTCSDTQVRYDRSVFIIIGEGEGGGKVPNGNGKVGVLLCWYLEHDECSPHDHGRGMIPRTSCYKSAFV